MLTALIAFLKNILFISLYGGLFYVVWQLTDRVIRRFTHWEPEAYDMFALVLPLTGVVGWLIFFAYFYISILA